MFLRLFQLLSTVLGLALATSAGAELIRTAVPRASLNYLSIYAAEAKGFFKDEGLENDTIAIGGPAAIAALLSGNVDFSGAGGSGLRAAAKGAELKAIFYQTEKVTWFFVVHPSIKSVADLKGKKIAVGLIGDSEDRFSTMMLQSIEFSLRRGCRYYYPGYAYREPFAYDYKKRFIGLEVFDWTGGWTPFRREDATPE